MLQDLAEFDTVFWRDPGTCVAGQNVTRCELWMNIIRVLPWARGKTLIDDYTAYFRDALQSENLEEIYAVLDLLRLRSHYWLIMHKAGWNFSHINQIEIEAMKVFYTRLSDRIEQTTIGHIDRNVVKPTVFPAKVRHLWQH